MAILKNNFQYLFPGTIANGKFSLSILTLKEKGPLKGACIESIFPKSQACATLTVVVQSAFTHYPLAIPLIMNLENKLNNDINSTKANKERYQIKLLKIVLLSIALSKIFT